jgi:hypothetical protein
MTRPDLDGWGVNAQGGAWSATYGVVFDTDTGQVWTLPRPAGAPDYGVTSAWADGRLLAFGGANFGGDGARLTHDAWLWTP